MAVTPVLISMTIDAAGTQEQVTATTTIKPASVYFEAHEDNTGAIYVGLSDVSDALYIAKLEAGEGISIDASHMADNQAAGGIQLSALWVDAEVSGEKCMVTYMDAAGA